MLLSCGGRSTSVIPALWNADIGEWHIPTQPGQLSNLTRPCSKIKHKNENKKQKLGIGIEPCEDLGSMPSTKYIIYSFFFWDANWTWSFTLIRTLTFWVLCWPWLILISNSDLEVTLTVNGIQLLTHPHHDPPNFTRISLCSRSFLPNTFPQTTLTWALKCKGDFFLFLEHL